MPEDNFTVLNVPSVKPEFPFPTEVVSIKSGPPAVADYLHRLFEEVSDELLTVYRRTNAPDLYGLVFPRNRNGSIRVSEQEAKQAFLFKLGTDSLYRFSVETPTCEAHGTGRRSANVDVSIYAHGHAIHTHVEFKHGNCALKGIRTSVEKLVREEKPGGWFHTLRAADKRTLPSIASKLAVSLDEICDYLQNSEPHLCLFAFCIIKSKRLFLRSLTLGGENSLIQCKEALRDIALWDQYELEESG